MSSEGDFAQGAFPGKGGTTFRVWAPRTEALALALEGEPPQPMGRAGGGFFELFVPGVGAGAHYSYLFPDGRRRPDPASRLQEESVHGPSTVVDLSFAWSDASWRGVPLAELVFYEIHVGAFSREGTFEAVAGRLAELVELGVTAIELMPVAAFDGDRGWGYDGVFPYAVHAPYGGPKGLQRLVDACHAAGLAVFLDVVYNHLGPSGNYLREFGPYFTSRHATPWGEAINFEGPDSGPVRELFVDNALCWIRDFHLDGLRLDAVHGIADDSSPHILQELNDRVQRLAAGLGREVHVIAESDRNDPRVVRRREEGGFGLAGQWSDDFHHALHALLTGERDGYYADFGSLEQLAKAFREPFVIAGQWSAFRNRVHGESARGIPGRRFVVFAQNHDQVGNRARGERLGALVAPAAARLAACATLLSPYLPLLFMGEEWDEPAPFLYFTSFPDPELGRAVYAGRKREFASFSWSGPVPDPQEPATFERSRIDPALARKGRHARRRRLYRHLLALRRQVPAFGAAPDEAPEVFEDAEGRNLVILRRHAGTTVALALHLSGEPGRIALPPGSFRPLLDSWDASWAEEGSARWTLGPDPVEGWLNAGPWHAVALQQL